MIVRYLLLGVLVLALAAPVRADSVWSTLRDEDGVVVLYRHALAPGGGDPVGFDVEDCATQRNLSGEGRRQAVRMGRELRDRDIPVTRVVSSPWCRARDTASLMRVGPVRELARLGSVFGASDATAERRERATKRLIRRHLDRPGVMVVAFHQANIIDLTGIAPTSGEGIVVRFDEAAQDIEVLGRIPAPPTTGS